jgi:glycosyl transferase family 25
MTASPLYLPALKVVLINLPRSRERRETMQQRLAELGLAYTLFAAVDGRAEQARLFEQVDVPAFQRNVGRDVLPGEIGCYFSHITVWQQFVDSGEDVLLVLEDDVVFGPDFIEALREALRVRAHWDFLKLNKIRAKQPISQGRVGPYELNAYLGPATGTGAYLIQRLTAQRLLGEFLPVTRPIDHELDRIRVHQLRHFGLEPFPSRVSDDSQSTITGQAFSAVKKYAWYARLSVYRLRWRNLWDRCFYLIKTGRLLPKKTLL